MSDESKLDEYREALSRAVTHSCDLAIANGRLRAGLKAVEGLINDSHGVAGLHLNGDVASWDELRTGGRFEEWLRDFDASLSTPGDGLWEKVKPYLRHTMNCAKKRFDEELGYWWEDGTEPCTCGLDAILRGGGET